MKIKVCGLKMPGNIKAVAALHPDYMGFIFYERSPRFVGNPTEEMLENIPASIQKTAVFVNESAGEINALIDKYHFDAIQLHGDEDPDFAHSFRNKVKVIKAFGVDNTFNFDKLNDYVNKADYFLFDTKTEKHGGSGKPFDWVVLDNYRLDVPFFLSGGISPENLEQVLNLNHPQLYGVDLNSKFEDTQGVKNIEHLTKAFETVKKAYTNEIRG
ncbi:MAG TPA: phosphoribosylanthranilate isomerase [Mucilaginibacter sp.]|jgi:phosphoribosylanthranilate isomerase|nr:phosphoribosylanthranilate isomerase [Mucilaginibacter sp.]